MPFGGLRDALWIRWVPLGVPRASLGGSRATLFGSLGVPGRRLGRLLRSLGVSLGSLASPGSPLGVLWGGFGVQCGAPGRLWNTYPKPIISVG